MKFTPYLPPVDTKPPISEDPIRPRTFIVGTVGSGAGQVPRLSTRLRAGDTFGAIAVRLGLYRNKYRVMPGLYAVGFPGSASPVLVSANYKLSFDALRRELGGLDLWILVLDTKGVNVWCSAGKGTFGDAELAKRIRMTRLGLVVEHRELILPQLSATGISAPKIRREAGWIVHFGPVLARDIPAYLRAGRVKTDAMRTMPFPLLERLKLVPLEFVHALPRLALLLLVWLLAAFLNRIYSGGIPATAEQWIDLVRRSSVSGSRAWIAVFSALIVGTGLVPALLPWIPFQAFSLKGLVAGILLALTWILVGKAGPLEAISLLLALPGISAWLALNFTGCTTYTSLAGVKAEISAARIPLILAMSCGLGLRTILLVLNGT